MVQNRIKESQDFYQVPADLCVHVSQFIATLGFCISVCFLVFETTCYLPGTWWPNCDSDSLTIAMLWVRAPAGPTCCTLGQGALPQLSHFTQVQIGS